MELVKQRFVLLYPSTKDEWIRDAMLVERAARTCYLSDDKTADKSYEKMIRALISRGHESPLEHAKVTVEMDVSRSIQQELTRHRLASYSIESTRYVNYAKKQGIQFIDPTSQKWGEAEGVVDELYSQIESTYNDLIQMGVRPERARDVLPLSLKSRVVMTANWREWRTIFKLRTTNEAHPDIRELMRAILYNFMTYMPCAFEGIYVEG
jgi:thymidylate synthase (FAD)